MALPKEGFSDMVKWPFSQRACGFVDGAAVVSVASLPPGQRGSVCCDEKPLCLEALTLPPSLLPPSYPSPPPPVPRSPSLGTLFKKSLFIAV